jgi:TPR repeat protein
MYNLGLFYETRIIEISLEYYRNAAEKGHSEAIKKVAELNIGNII